MSQTNNEPTVEDLRSNLLRLLNAVGDRGFCKGCGAAIYWVQHKNGKKAPYTQDALNHFADCPKAKDFKR